jgi:hypothetical protein
MIGLWPGCVRFFYKYDPLHNAIVKNEPLSNYLTKIAWRKVEKAPRGYSRHCVWRHRHPAVWSGGRGLQALPLAGRG